MAELIQSWQEIMLPETPYPEQTRLDNDQTQWQAMMRMTVVALGSLVHDSGCS